MATLESDDVAAALLTKMGAVTRNKHDIYYNIFDKAGTKLASTRISHGGKETLGASRVREMALQLRLDDATSLVNLVQCSLSREQALEMMKRNPRYAPYMKR